MHMATLQDLFVDQLRDLYNAENQLVKALPKMAKSASSPDLQTAFESHLEQTKGHVERLEQIFNTLGASPKGKKCKAMEGLIEEGKEMMEEDAEPEIMDAGLIAAAQRVEHYEIAAYEVLMTTAEAMGETEVVKLLSGNLDQELKALAKMKSIGKRLAQEGAKQAATG